MFNKGCRVSTWLHGDRTDPLPLVCRKAAEPLHLCQATSPTLDCSVVSQGSLSSDFLFCFYFKRKEIHLSCLWKQHEAFSLLVWLLEWSILEYTGLRCVFFFPSCHNASTPRGSPPAGDWDDCTWSQERRLRERTKGKPTAGQETTNEPCKNSVLKLKCSIAAVWNVRN